METRTNIVLDDELVAKAMSKAGVSTKKAAIEQALRAFVSEPDWDFVLSMEGSNAIADDYDPSILFDHDPGLALRAAEPRAAYTASKHRSNAAAAAPAGPAKGRRR